MKRLEEGAVRELTAEELEDIHGGIAWFVIAAAAAVTGTTIGADAALDGPITRSIDVGKLLEQGK
jgi:lactobin A/cerein 7B family class IIb bacteriocin